MEEAGRFNLLIEQREYKLLEDEADIFIREEGWSSFLDLVEYLPNSQQFITKGIVAPGKTRDALLFLLSLDVLEGIDVDLKEQFQKLDGESIVEIRQQAQPIAMNILKEQIKRKNTYFLDVERISKSPFAILIPDIIEARKQEIVNLAPETSINMAITTFYGFNIFTTGGRLTGDSPGNVQTLVDALETIAKDFGIELKVKGSKLKGISNRSFTNCSDLTGYLLEACITLIGYAKSAQAKSSRFLASIRDSRALPFIQYKLDENPSGNLRTALLNALGEIGHPSSVDFIRSKVQQDPGKGGLLVRELGRIGGEDAQEYVVELLSHRTSSIRTKAAETISNMKGDFAAPSLEKLLSDKRKAVGESALSVLLDANIDITDILLRNIAFISRIVVKMPVPKIMLEKLIKHELIIHNEEFISLVVQCFKAASRRQQNLKFAPRVWIYKMSDPSDILRTLCNVEEVMSHPRVIKVISEIIISGNGSWETIRNLDRCNDLLLTSEIQEGIIQHIQNSSEYILFSLQAISSIKQLRTNKLVADAFVAKKEVIVAAIEKAYDIFAYYPRESSSSPYLDAICSLRKFSQIIDLDVVEKAVYGFLQEPPYRQQSPWNKDSLSKYMDSFPNVRNTEEFRTLLLKRIDDYTVRDILFADEETNNSEAVIEIFLEQIRTGRITPGTETYNYVIAESRVQEVSGFDEVVAESLTRAHFPAEAFFTLPENLRSYPPIFEIANQRIDKIAEATADYIVGGGIRDWGDYFEKLPALQAHPAILKVLTRRVEFREGVDLLSNIAEKYPNIIESKPVRKAFLNFLSQHHNSESDVLLFMAESYIKILDGNPRFRKEIVKIKKMQKQ